MTLLSAHVALFVVVRFSAACAIAVAFAFALASNAVFALPFAIAFAVVVAAAFAVAFLVAFALACVIHVHWICFSEVVHDPCLVRVQVGLDDRSQVVAVILKLFRVHQQMVPHAAPR